MTININFLNSNIEWHARDSGTQIFSIIGYGENLPVADVPENTDQIKVIVKDPILNIEETSSILSWPTYNTKFDYIFKDPNSNCRFILKGLTLQGNALSSNVRESINSYIPLNHIDDFITVSGDINVKCAIVDPVTYQIWEETGGVFPEDLSSFLYEISELAVYDVDVDSISVELGCSESDSNDPKVQHYFQMDHIESFEDIRICYDHTQSIEESYLIANSNVEIEDLSYLQESSTIPIIGIKCIGIGGGLDAAITQENSPHYRLQNGNLFAGWFSVGMIPEAGYGGPGGLTSFEIPIQGTDFYLEVAQSYPGELLSIVLAVKNGCVGGNSAYNIDCSANNKPSECANVLNYDVGDVVFPDDPTDGYFRIGWQKSNCSSHATANCYSGLCSEVQTVSSMPSGLIFLAFWVDPLFEQLSFRMNNTTLTYNIPIDSSSNENPKLIFGKHSNYQNPSITPPPTPTPTQTHTETPTETPDGFPPTSYFAGWVIYNNANMIITQYLDWLYNSGKIKYLRNTACWPNPGITLE